MRASGGGGMRLYRAYFGLFIQWVASSNVVKFPVARTATILMASLLGHFDPYSCRNSFLPDCEAVVAGTRELISPSLCSLVPAIWILRVWILVISSVLPQSFTSVYTYTNYVGFLWERDWMPAAVCSVILGFLIAYFIKILVPGM